jgi:hypothetical protein
MFIRISAILLAIVGFSSAAFSADEIKVDAAKYPQDTPQKAMESIIKALDTNNDLGYWIAWLVTPDYTQRMIETHKSIDATVAANQDEKHVNGRKQMIAAMKKMLEAKTTTEGESNGVKWFCYKLGESQLVQLEMQKDGRWCQNPKIRATK